MRYYGSIHVIEISYARCNLSEKQDMVGSMGFETLRTMEFVVNVFQHCFEMLLWELQTFTKQTKTTQNFFIKPFHAADIFLYLSWHRVPNPLFYQDPLNCLSQNCLSLWQNVSHVTSKVLFCVMILWTSVCQVLAL